VYRVVIVGSTKALLASSFSLTALSLVRDVPGGAQIHLSIAPLPTHTLGPVMQVLGFVTYPCYALWLGPGQAQNVHNMGPKVCLGIIYHPPSK